MPVTYLAPGVYVEEVPSAQQPIAGVGTNTVGFVGIVPDVIKYPVANDWYDPHLAEIIQRGEGASKEEKMGSPIQPRPRLARVIPSWAALR